MSPDRPSGAAADAIDAICDRFEAAWMAGERPELRDYLPASIGLADVRTLAIELLLVDLAWRWRGSGPRLQAFFVLDPRPMRDVSQLPLPDCPRLEDYACRYPELGPWDDLPDRVVGEEYRLRRVAGEQPNYCDYVRRFRKKGCGLRNVLAAVDEQLARAAVEAQRRGGKLPWTLGRYVLLEYLGRGGMGAVYKARHVPLDRLVAVKLLPADLLGHSEVLARFSREVQAVSRLDHPHLVHALDADIVGDVPLLAMEYVDGWDAARLVRRLGPLPLAEACEIARRAAFGLQYAHQQGLVHRDVKPANIMVARDGAVKVLDLGLACVRGHTSIGQGLTQTGQVVGTCDYTPPEQILDPRTVDGCADIYSLGCSLYEMLCGRKLFDAPDFDTPGKKLVAHVTVPPPSVARWRPETSPELLDLLHGLHGMLQKSPAERIGNMGEVTERLAPFARGANVPALFARIAGENGAHGESAGGASS